MFAEATSWSAGFGQMPTPPRTPRSVTTPTPVTSFSMLRGAATPPMAHREVLSHSPHGSMPYISPPLESAWNSSPMSNAQSMPLLRCSATPPMPPMMQSQFPEFNCTFGTNTVIGTVSSVRGARYLSIRTQSVELPHLYICSRRVVHCFCSNG